MFVIVSMTEHCISVTDYLSHLVFSKKKCGKYWHVYLCVVCMCLHVPVCFMLFNDEMCEAAITHLQTDSWCHTVFLIVLLLL